jgi:localization factor PodJL
MKDATGLAVDAAGGEGPRGSGMACEAHDLKLLLNVIADQIADADRRHSQALVEMQDRLGVLGHVAQDLRGRLPDAMTPALDRIESNMAALTSRIAEDDLEAAGTIAARAAPDVSEEQSGGPAPLRSAMSADALGVYSRRDGMTNIDRFDVVDSGSKSLDDEPWDEVSAEALTRIYEDDNARLEAVARNDRAAGGRSEHDEDRAEAHFDEVGVHPIDVEPATRLLTAETATSPNDAAHSASHSASAKNQHSDAQGSGSSLDERLADIATRLERSFAGIDRSGSVDQISARVQSLEESIVKAMAGSVTRADLSSLKSIEHQVEDLTARFDTVQTHFSRLDTIELELRALAERISEDRLVKLLDGSGSSTPDDDKFTGAVSAKFAEHMPIIEDALKTIADRVSKENLAAMMEAPAQNQPDIAHIARLVAEQVALRMPKQERHDNTVELRRIDDLSALLQSYVSEKRQGDEQTNAMLDTMQQAMIRLLDRMEAIESMPTAGYDDGEPLGEEPPEFDLPEERLGSHGEVGHGELNTAGVVHDFDADPQLPEPGTVGRQGAELNAGVAHQSTEAREEPYVPNQRFQVEPQADDAAAKPAAPGNREYFIAAARRAARQAALAPAEPAVEEAEPANAKKRSRSKPEKGAKKRSLSLAAMALICVVIAGASFTIFKSTILSSKPGVVTTPVPAAAPGVTKDKRLKNLEDADVIIEEKKPEPKATDGKAGGSGERRSDASPDMEVRTHRALSEQGQGNSGDFTSAFDGAAQRAVSATEALQGGLPPARSEFVRQYASSASGGPDTGEAASHRVPASLTKDFSGAGVHQAPAAPMPPLTIGPLSLRSAAAKGDPSAQFEVGARFAEGKGVIQDLKQSVAWYQRSAAQGFAPAQYRLASMYERGLGVSQDLARAKIWYQRAAEQGIVKAMHNLAVLSAGRDSATPDYATAGKWFTLAAEHGLTDSQFNLAIMYDSGLGIERNARSAYKWFSLAARSGDAEASRRRVSLRSKMTAAELKAVEAELASWQPRKADDAMNDPRQAGSLWMRRAN